MKKSLLVLPILFVVALAGLVAVSCNKKPGPTESDVLQYFKVNKSTLIQLSDQLKNEHFSSEYWVSVDHGELYFTNGDQSAVISNPAVYDLVAKVKGFQDIRVCFDRNGKFAMILTVLSLRDGVWYGIYYVEDENMESPIICDDERKLEDNWYLFYIGLV